MLDSFIVFSPLVFLVVGLVIVVLGTVTLVQVVVEIRKERRRRMENRMIHGHSGGP